MNLEYERDEEFASSVRKDNQQFLKLYPQPMTNRSSSMRPSISLRQKAFPGNTSQNRLKQIVTASKVKMMTQNFMHNLQKNNIYRTPLDENILNCEKEQTQFQKKKETGNLKSFLQNTTGLKLNQYILVVWSLFNVIQLLVMTFVFTINITFPESEQVEWLEDIQYVSLVLYIMDFLLNCTVQKNEYKQRALFLGDIMRNYLKNGLIIDLFSIIFYPIGWLGNFSVAIVLAPLTIVKLLNNIQRFEKFEYLFLNTKEKEQYYSLFRVFFINFAIGHFLSLLLNLMAWLNAENNWYYKLNVQHEEWIVKYIWGYYWGTNIMLTVGFGDLSASSHVEAAILIFVETFSCITLAYNISNVGTLISELKANHDSKKKQLKTFHVMCKQNDIPQELESKVSHFIEESFQIKESFQFDEYDSVLERLPKSLQSEYLKQANKTLFGSLGFLSNLSKRTFLNLAESVNRKIAHPGEILYKKGESASFNILSKGKLAYACRLNNSEIHGLEVEHFSVQKDEKPKLLSLDFVKRGRLTYDIRSSEYSIIYFLSREEFIEILRNSEMDYELFCTIQDRNGYIDGENQLYKCSICRSSFHTKFRCDRLHYIPIAQHTIHKYLGEARKMRQNRVQRGRKRKERVQTIIDSKQFSEQQYRFLMTYFGEKYVIETANTRNIHEKLNLIDHVQEIQSLSKVEDRHYRPLGTYHNSRESELVKIQKLIMKSQNEYQDVFWEIELDLAHNFRYYLNSWNAQRLKKQERLGRQMNMLLKSIRV